MRTLSNEHGFLDKLSRLRIYRDEATHEKIHRHLTDINDTITDEDIRNIRILFAETDKAPASQPGVEFRLPQAS